MTAGPALGFLRPAAALCAFALGWLPAAPVAAQPADAAPRVQTVSEFVRIADAFATVDAVLHRPAGAQPAVGLVYTHPFAQSSLSGYVCDALPRRGFAVLCFNNRLSNNQQFNSIWEPIALDVAAAVSEMRRRGYARVVLIGLSAGGPTMAYCQDVAENGNAVFRDGATLSGFRGFFGRDGAERRLPPADGVILTNPSSGIGASGLLRLDPSVVDEQTGRRDPSLDMYEAANGYDAATGTARYAPAFLARFRAAQCDRMNRLIEATRARQAAVRAGTARFADDDVAVIGVPLLVMQGTGDNTIVHLTVAELIHDAASRTPDRTLWYVRGATHVMTALRPEFGDVPGIVADALAGWLRERYR
jgi:alpha-beta hydrolase superfamily lysophospholipase